MTHSHISEAEQRKLLLIATTVLQEMKQLMADQAHFFEIPSAKVYYLFIQSAQ